MTISSKTQDRIAALLLVVVVLLQVFSSSNLSYNGNIQDAARRLQIVLNKDIKALEGFMQDAAELSPDSRPVLKGIRKDMVVYKYYSDTLHSWVGEFPIMNDDLRAGLLFPFISNPRNTPYSPLAQVSEQLSYTNLGEKWFLLKSITRDNCTVIGGLEINNEQNTSIFDGTNRNFHLPDQFSIRPLNYDGGAPVYLEGQPLFVITCEGIASTVPLDSTSLWLSLTLLIVAALFFLNAKKSTKRLFITIFCLSVIMLAVYIAGRSIRERFTMFSPLLYAGSDVLYSLGAIVIINMAILVLSLSLFIARDALCKKLKGHIALIICMIMQVLLIISIVVYTFFSLRSIILNSAISLELYKIAELSPFCVVVYISYISMSVGIPLLLQSCEPFIRRETGVCYNLFSNKNRIIYASIIAISLVTCSSLLGFKKEQDKMQILSSRLAFERDVPLELYLKSIEDQVAEDMVISSLSVFSNSSSTIKAHFSDRYFSLRDRSYSVSIFVFNNNNKSRASLRQYKHLTNGAQAITDGSRFFYVKRDGGQSYYLGTFVYLLEGSGVTRVLIKIDTRDARDDKGYAGIFGLTSSGRAAIPPGYSVARYEGTDLVSYRGTYAFPTKMSNYYASVVYSQNSGHLSKNAHRHFHNLVAAGNESIIITRPKISIINYGVAGILVGLFAYLCLSLLLLGRRSKKDFSHSYFRSRITIIVLTSLVMTLIVIAGVSVGFVYTRNEKNNMSLMIDRIGSISSMLEANHEQYELADGRLDWRAMRSLVDNVSDDMRSDITLYSPGGKMLFSTTPMVFERHILGERIESGAFNTIIHEHRRTKIIRNRTRLTRYFNMYASVLGSNGDIIAIVCSPYNAKGFDFEEDAAIHASAIIALFILFLLISRLIVTRIVDRMFRPLSEMSKKMNNADIQSLELIDYKRDDEISSIVQSYNLMVKELMASSRKLAQAERDKAWSEMARQVAHEIKNPLTPMKLQIQRVMRLKANNNPQFLERLDEASKLLLDHIDILTETANEFSSFAKLYSEEPTEIDLAKAIQSELSMFESHANVHFEYIGLEGVFIKGPKPQLIRVFVNLLNNSVQAIGDKENGQVRVSLRKSSKQGYYDIVFEDNGPGVEPKNIEHLFTPNFTTKSGGSGLGLAISRSVLENCSATIRYKKSFSLGGACFVITYPDN